MTGHVVQNTTQFPQKKECCAGALEGSFLKSLVRLTGPKTVLKVGMFTGTSMVSKMQHVRSIVNNVKQTAEAEHARLCHAQGSNI